MIDFILLCNYSLSVLLCRKKKNRYEYGTEHLFSTELIFGLISLMMYIIPKIKNYYMTNTHGLIILIIISLFVISLDRWTKYHISWKKNNIRQQYKNLKGKTLLYTTLGWVLFVGSFVLMFVVGILHFSGYDLRFQGR